ncbi:XRE family transcriptional regulator [Ruminococcus sp. AM29-12LB]|nr:XRE family transcriptional regulator [Ruminococcus sp. AM29-12LB]
MTFGSFLKELIKNTGRSQADFYQELGIKKAYFYDIVSGRTNPPPHELQIKAMEILDVTQADRIYFYDLAAKERGDVPADITKWINDDPNAKTRIRKIMRN